MQRYDFSSFPKIFKHQNSCFPKIFTFSTITFFEVGLHVVPFKLAGSTGRYELHTWCAPKRKESLGDYFDTESETVKL